MLQIPGRIPINIHPFFWLLAGLIGWLNSGSLIGILVWIGIIFVSVLVHEFGHALTALCFGKNPRIDLVALGGLTSYEPSGLGFFKQFIIVFNGPLFGILLAFFAMFLLYLNIFTSPIMISILTIFKVVNFFWSFVNLIPILPLDGGQLLRIVLEAIFGLRGFKISLFIGMVISFGAALFFFFMRYFLVGALFFLFAFQSFDSWRRSRDLSDVDRKDDNKKRLMDGENALMEGRKQDAKICFEEIRRNADKGVIFTTATQYLALLYYEEQRRKEAYDLLLSIQDKLTSQTVCLLHNLAFENQNYELVVKLATECYQLSPSQEVAFMNAKAFAYLNNPRHAGGWLQTAFRLGKFDLEKIISDPLFEKVRNHPEFVQFISKLKE